ncbi:TIGR03364 family FAD-dependent oxidoreductase [Paludisphaera soli]|uniref:TIGR03364 family FAD-dependent oxidoreductase n=1 Tax=Paludisphaera soli TaxID=2712865 RepID=UPI001F105AFF|nr:TIGR03364 family FAD-dependent oxidoreductase [Paludisphaera soli]
MTVFERSSAASAASIRNFGMVWPIGQPAGEAHAIAMRSRGIWLDIANGAGIWANPCGSINLANRDDEWDVLREFADVAPSLGYDCRLLTPGEIAELTDFANPTGLIGGLHSPCELCVNPRKAIRDLPRWLASRFGVRFEFGSAITGVGSGWAVASDGSRREFDRIVVCGGADFKTLFPDLCASSGLRRCKLQMLKVGPPASGRLGPHLASGLTLRHYGNFAACSGLPGLRDRIAAETPELDEFGIHVMVSQNDEGDLILGDSHEYDSAVEPFDKAVIDDLILRELRRVIRLPSWNVTERWHGIYAKHPTRSSYVAEPMPGVSIRSGVGGAGMTMAFGLADRTWEEWS